MSTRTVWKFPLEPGTTEGVGMPAGAEIIHAAAQGDDVCLWAIVDSTQPSERRRIAVLATGGAVPEGATYIGTALMYNAALVWHVFEIGRATGEAEGE